MVRALHVEVLRGDPVSTLETEIVERKGKGHPDSLIDGACESVSRALCQFYTEHFGTILHHNVDKGLLVGGRAHAVFGGGDVLDPIVVTVAGRAASEVTHDGRTEKVPVEELARTAVRAHLRRTMRFLDPDRHVRLEAMIRPGSADLVQVFAERGRVPLANDTSIGVGYAPSTPTERLVLETERLLNSPEVKRELPEVGEDIKVMGLRRGRRIDLTVALPVISSLCPDASHYISVLEDAKRRVEDMVRRVVEYPVDVWVNEHTKRVRGAYYLTVTGTSAEAGDDGNTGRGNRPSGLITPMRQYSMEATAGKNPVNHTGKLYNVIAQRTADRIVAEVGTVREVYVRLLSRIGVPIDEPQIASAAVVLDAGAGLANVRREVEAILDAELARVLEVTPLILQDAVTLF